MERHDDPYMRRRVMALFVADNRDWLGTKSITERIYNSSGREFLWDTARVRSTMRRLRKDGLVEQDEAGDWRFTRAGLVRAQEELHVAGLVAEAERRRKQVLRDRDEAIRNGTYVPPPQPASVPRVTENTFEDILRCGWSGGRMQGAKLIITEKPRE